MRIWGIATACVVALTGCSATAPGAILGQIAAPPTGQAMSSPDAASPSAQPTSPTSTPPPLPASVTKTPQEIAQVTFPSVVLLVMTNSRGEEFSQGSGFFVQDGVIATNFHVIEGAISGYAKVIGTDQKFIIDGVVGTDKTNDLALLKISGSSAPVMPLGAPPMVGDEAYAIGNPRGLEGTFSQGIVSSLRNDANGSLVQITAPISPGSSGGPVVNNRGQVIGVATATLRDSQNLNFAVPVALVEKLITNKTTAKSLVEVTGAAIVSNTSVPQSGYLKFENQAFSFNYPSSWRVQNFPDERTIVKMSGPNAEGMLAIDWRVAEFNLVTMAEIETRASTGPYPSMKNVTLGGLPSYFFSNVSSSNSDIAFAVQGVIAMGIFYRISGYWTISDKSGSSWFTQEMDKLASSWVWK